MSQHLSYPERVFIEKSLVKDSSFATIARVLGRSPSTIAREVLHHRAFVSDPAPDSSRDCVYYHSCTRSRVCPSLHTFSCLGLCKFCSDLDCRSICDRYISSHCSKLDRPPYVCTNCPSLHGVCKRNHAFYSAHRADGLARKERSQSRSGFRTAPEDLDRISSIILPLLKRGQSLNHIYATHGDELGISIRTLYNYIDSGTMRVRNIDLPKKVVYRIRRKKKVVSKHEYRYRIGRTYADFKAFMDLHHDLGVVEMDTVKGKRGSLKVLLTFILPRSDFFLAFLMSHGGEKDVLSVFDFLTRLLGVETFYSLFPVILTDNGVEFKDPNALEFSESGLRRTNIFFCDPMSPTQKPRIEKAHVLLRRIIPKGTSFATLSQSDIHLMLCHLNSFFHESLDNRTPFDLMLSPDEKKLLTALELSPVPPDDVNLSPALIKH